MCDQQNISALPELLAKVEVAAPPVDVWRPRAATPDGLDSSRNRDEERPLSRA